jgi:hypothetical protein
MGDQSRSAVEPSRSRDIAFAALSFLFGAASLGGLFGIGIVIGWFNNDEAGIHRVHDIGFGIAYGVLAAAAFFALVARGGRLPSIALQVAAVALGVIAGAAASADLGYAVLALGLLIALGVLLAISPNRRVLVSTRVDLSPVLAAFVLVAAVPLVCAGLTWARYQRDGFPLDPHVAQSHWATMAAMAFCAPSRLRSRGSSTPGVAFHGVVRRGRLRRLRHRVGRVCPVSCDAVVLSGQ